MPPNIFHANAITGPEDRFTAHWHYLLDTHPELGQRVLDHIAAAAGFQTTTYEGVDDHPWFTSEDRPDFRIRGADYDVLCEHKLDSALGPAQIERYAALAISSARPTHVILIGKSPTAVPPSATSLSCYQAPRGADCSALRQHFLWEDFYPLVAATEGRLAADFRAYMASLGLDPWSWGEIGDPTQPGTALEHFRRLWAEILPRYRRAGAVAKVDPVGPGFQYQRPLPGVHLIWCGPQRTLEAPEDARVPGRIMTLRVWQMTGDAAPSTVLLGASTTDILTSQEVGVETFIRRPMKAGRTFGVLTREYYTSLGGILEGSWPEAQQRLARWTDGVLAHLAADVGAFGAEST